MASVEDVIHQVPCSICKSKSIQGFRYKCQKCSNFNMCQNCFWQGKTSENHRTDHEVKEYSFTSANNKSFRNSFRKSFRWAPDKSKKMPRFPDKPDKPLNLSHIVPPSPLPTHNGFSAFEHLDAYSDRNMFALELGQCPNRTAAYPESLNETDEEHRLIARYTARLASESKYPPAPMYLPPQRSKATSHSSINFFETTQNQKDLISELEARNREIMREISELRAQQELNYMNGVPNQPYLMEELQALRHHKSDLEGKLMNLQDSRRHLMGQMESIMRLLKSQHLNERSPTNSSSTKSPMSAYSGGYGSLHRSAPSTPHHSDAYSALPGELRYAYSGEDFLNASDDSSTNSRGQFAGFLRNDLLVAADSVTTAISSLVKELNSGSDEETEIENGDSHIAKPLDYPQTLKEERHLWNECSNRRFEEDSKFLAQLRARRLSDDFLEAQRERSIYERFLSSSLPHSPESDLNFSKLYSRNRNQRKFQDEVSPEAETSHYSRIYGNGSTEGTVTRDPNAWGNDTLC